MIARDVMHHSGPPSQDSPPLAGGSRLTSEERRAIQEAAEADGYSTGFADLLCRFAELIGTDEVLRELERIDFRE
jgi:hypothetical protein